MRFFHKSGYCGHHEESVLDQIGLSNPGHEIINLLPCSTQLSIKF